VDALAENRRLESWKEVAAYLKRDVSTVRRWERREGLPVHRQIHAKRDSIYAHTDEIDRWLQGRSRAADAAAPPVVESQTGRAFPLLTIALSVILGLGLVVLAGVLAQNRSKEALPAVGEGDPSHPRDLTAYRLYLRGRQRMEARTGAGFTAALADFREAIEKDPAFALAYAGLADANNLMGYYRFRAPRESYQDAKASILKALELDDALAEAHASLAGLLAYYEWDWSGAEREYRRALALDPSFVSARHWYANCLSLMGRHEEAIAQAREAVNRQPLSMITLTGALGNAYVQAGRFDQAAEQYRSAINLDPAFGNAHAALAGLYWRKGLLDEAWREMKTATGLGDNPGWTIRLAALHAALGQPGEAHRILDTLQQRAERPAPVGLATLYLQLGESERAFSILEGALDARDPDLPSAKTEPGLESLRGQPRFQALLRRLNLL